MSNIIIEQENQILTITLNKPNKHNAFDDEFIQDLQIAIDEAAQNDLAKVVILRANGKNFSAGADLGWMKRMAEYSRDENIADALKLAKLIHSIYELNKPTIAMVQGLTFGGGLGIIAACDIAIAENCAKFCFSEVKLGLIPAVISPYVVEAIGPRNAKWLFLSAELFDASQALNINFIQHMVEPHELCQFSKEYAQKLTEFPSNALVQAKSLVNSVKDISINAKSLLLTAEMIAKQRASTEAQTALAKFLNKSSV